MTRIKSLSPEFLLQLNPQDGNLQRQLFQAIRRAILSGALLNDAQLPSSRVLAEALGVSRTTVSRAIDQLAAEGYLIGRERSGVFVCLPEDETLKFPRPHDAPFLPPMRATVLGSLADIKRTPPTVRPFSRAAPDLAHFPWAAWARITARRWRNPDPEDLHYGDSMGRPRLRAAIAQYLRIARGVIATPSQIMVVSGSQQALFLCAQVLLATGDSAWIEDPGYSGARDAMLAAGVKPTPVRVDKAGIDVAYGRRTAPAAKLIYVTPSHQFPTGAILTPDRRMELLNWAAASGAWIVEDDYDSEFRYGARPISALQASQGGEDSRVIYVGTFSKTLFPSLRIGFLVLPTGLEKAFAAARLSLDLMSPGVEQTVLAEFYETGLFARHVRRARTLYAARRETLVAALEKYAPGVFEIAGAQAGLHMAVYLRAPFDPVAVQAKAEARGLYVERLQEHASLPLPRDGLILGYAAYTQEALRLAASTLIDCLG